MYPSASPNSKSTGQSNVLGQVERARDRRTVVADRDVGLRFRGDEVRDAAAEAEADDSRTPVAHLGHRPQVFEG